jgi:hypothetical protein
MRLARPRAMLHASSDKPDEQQLREARFEAARRMPLWQEARATDFVRRGPWLVHDDSDQLCSFYRGLVFASHSAAVVSDHAELLWYLDANDNLVFVEREPGTWSQVVERQARRGR